MDFWNLMRFFPDFSLGNTPFGFEEDEIDIEETLETEAVEEEEGELEEDFEKRGTSNSLTM